MAQFNIQLTQSINLKTKFQNIPILHEYVYKQLNKTSLTNAWN